MATDRTDDEVIRASCTEPELFALIFDRHVRSVHSFLDRRVGADGADSLTGETFRIAFERRTTYLVDRSNSLPWLYGIAHNLLRHHWRRLAREGRSLRRLGPIEHSDSQDDALLDRVAAQARPPVGVLQRDGSSPARRGTTSPTRARRLVDQDQARRAPPGDELRDRWPELCHRRPRSRAEAGAAHPQPWRAAPPGPPVREAVPVVDRGVRGGATSEVCSGR
jgi:DNA-directed RNA polymerase specialized sigma24 family protein